MTDGTDTADHSGGHVTKERKGIGRLDAIVIDVQDHDRAVEFWGKILGISEIGRGYEYVFLGRQSEGVPVIGLQVVPERSQRKNPVHFDIRVEDVEAAAAEVVEAGGMRLTSVHGWIVMADPDGNEFCLVPERE